MDIAQDEKVIIHRGKGRSFAVVPMNDIKENTNLLNDAQNKAINEALEDIADGRVQSHEQAMKTLKNRHPKYFK